MLGNETGMTSFTPQPRKRAVRRRLVPALLAIGGMLGLGLAVMPADSAGAATTPAASVIATMMQSYNSGTGLIDRTGSAAAA